MKTGPNVRRLIIEKASIDAIPPGGGFKDGVAFLSDPQKMIAVMKSASTWVIEAIRLVREATGPNQWSKSSDEEIAGEILNRLRSKKEKRS